MNVTEIFEAVKAATLMAFDESAIASFFVTKNGTQKVYECDGNGFRLKIDEHGRIQF